MTTAVEETAWLSYSQAQKYSGLGRTKLWQLVSSGEVKAARVGRSVRISRLSLEHFMQRHAVQLKLPGIDDAD